MQLPRATRLVSTIAGEHVWIWRALDDEAEVMDMIVQKRRDVGAALRLMPRLLRNQHVEPEVIVTDGLRSHGAALQRLGLSDRHGLVDCRTTIAPRTRTSVLTS